MCIQVLLSAVLSFCIQPNDLVKLSVYVHVLFFFFFLCFCCCRTIKRELLWVREGLIDWQNEFREKWQWFFIQFYSFSSISSSIIISASSSPNVRDIVCHNNAVIRITGREIPRFVRCNWMRREENKQHRQQTTRNTESVVNETGSTEWKRARDQCLFPCKYRLV